MPAERRVPVDIFPIPPAEIPDPGEAARLDALSPLDGRYEPVVRPLKAYFSEQALIRTRVGLEVTYLHALSEAGIIRPFTDDEVNILHGVVASISPGFPEHGQRVKTIEKITNHDLQAAVNYVKESIAGTSLDDVLERVHFGLTSEDINNLAQRLLLREATNHVMLPAIDTITQLLMQQAVQYKTVPMLGRTHGQDAMPTTVGKELAVYAQRFHEETGRLIEANDRLAGKFGGAIGTDVDRQFAEPGTDWREFSRDFVKSLGLDPKIATTQINPAEDIIALLQTYKRINGVTHDLAVNMSLYIGDDCFIQQVVQQESGSSAMPQKVNPIQFENAEGNSEKANTYIEVFERQLPNSRFQRDLSTSTIMRGLGEPLGYSLVAYDSLRKGLKRIVPNKEQLLADLDANWGILSGAILAVLRRENVEYSYDEVKAAFRGKRVDESTYREIVKGLPVSDEWKAVLLDLTPAKHIGYCTEIVDEVVARIQPTLQ